ncbi:MAG TPA: all3515 family Zur-repressed PEP-CTERM protein [Tepidisphaeraceae bacterium]|nr:all3515 family Zur-repressed PEP-CTERM protein [Tepidisphaeraceae bacterium]
MNRIANTAGAVALALVGLIGPADVQADIATYYIGLDGRSAPFNEAGTVPAVAYPDNPNHNRLTLLLAHGNHYHSIGTYNYTGPAGSPTLNDTSTNNRLPETYQNMPPISLQSGTGSTWGGTFRSGLPSAQLQDVEYGNLEFRNAHSLVNEGVEGNVLFNSSSGRWNDSLDGADIHLELISATPGLSIAIGGNMNALTAGSDVHLGDGDEFFQVLPTFWVDDSAAPGSTYSAEFRLTDGSGTFGDSGRFFMDFQVAAVPEPGALGLLGACGLAALKRRRRVGGTQG